MTGLTFAGQASASTYLDFSDALMNAPGLSPVAFKFNGFTQTIDGTTSGLFFFDSWAYNETGGGVPIAYSASSTGVTSFGYAVFSDFFDTNVPGESTGGTWALYESSTYYELDDDAIDIAAVKAAIEGGVKLLSGDFAEITTATGPDVTLSQTVNVVTSGSTPFYFGAGNAYANITGGDQFLRNYYNANLRPFGSDFEFSFTYSSQNVPTNWMVGDQGSDQWTPDFANIGVRVSDPGRGNAVPEPGTMLLFGMGLMGLTGLSRRRQR